MGLPRRAQDLSLKLTFALFVYRIAWYVVLPFVLVYFWRRGKREPEYRRHWRERFGLVSPHISGPLVWFHGASLGELKGASPLIRALVESGVRLLVTTHTPAGRRVIEELCADAIEQGRLQIAYCPLEFGWTMQAFIQRSRPQRLLVTEIDTWPVMLDECRRAGIETCLVNAQYPKTSFERDQQWGAFRSDVFTLYSMIICKTPLHAERFYKAGCTQVRIAGETRFDLPQPPQQLKAAREVVSANGLCTPQRPVICMASCGPGEEALFIAVYCELQRRLEKLHGYRPLFVHVPRSPQRFEATFDLLQSAGLAAIRRSEFFDSELYAKTSLTTEIDVLLGDSLGEMSFYLALSQLVVVGNSFNGLGAHNIIEPLALKKPVVVGPSIWGIEYPAQEALATGALIQVGDEASLCDTLARMLVDPAQYQSAREALAGFHEDHAGATTKHMVILEPWLNPTTL
jgi:3-deoxy-D-manno-octulosonic-acid transferase